MADSRPLRATDELRVYVGDGPSDATVQLVYEAINAARDLNKAHFRNVETQLARLESLPGQMATLLERVDNDRARIAALEAGTADLGTLATRVGALESSEHAENEYRRLHLPTLVLALVGLAISVAGLAGFGGK